ncbi:MAG: peptidylprolyl isomerase [Acidobacteriota bacterium]
MFDLFRSRDKAIRYVVGGILGIVALSMITYLIPNYNDNTGTAQNPVVLEVGGQKITASEAQGLFQQNSQGKIPAELMDVYFPQFLDRLLMVRAATYQAGQMGLTATDDEVRTAMLTKAPYNQFVQNGKLNREALEAALAQQGKTLQYAIDDTRDNLLLEKLLRVVGDNTIVTPQEVEAEYRKRNEKASVEYMAFPAADFRSAVVVSDDDIKKRYEERKASFTKPEKFGFRVLVMDHAKVEAGIQISDADLRAAYSGSLDNFRKPERVRSRHILLSTEGKTDAEKAAQKTKAENLLKQVKGGADFAALAKANSEDSSNAPKGGDLGWATRGQYDPAFDAAVFATKPNEFADIVTTQFGYHVVQVLEKEASSIAPFETVRADVEKDLRGQKAAEKMQAAGDQLHADLVKNPSDLDNIAKKYGAEVITVKEAAAGDPIPTLGVTPELTSQLATLKAGGVTDIAALPGERLAVAVMEARIPGRPSTLDEVKGEIKESIIAEKVEGIAAERAKSAGERVRKGEDFEAVAKSVGVKVQTATNFSRPDTVEGLGAAVYMEEAFTKPVGTIIGPSVIQGRNVLAKVTGKKAADMSELAAKRDDLTKELRDAKQQSRTELWLDSVLTKLTAEGKVVRHQDEIQRVVAQYHESK